MQKLLLAEILIFEYFLFLVVTSFLGILIFPIVTLQVIINI